VVGLLVRLHLTLTVRQLRASPAMLVSTILMGLTVLSMGVLAFVGLAALRQAPAVRDWVTVLALALLTLAWPAMTVFLVGSNEMLDIGRFALLPVRARQLVPGLFVAGLLGFGGLFTLFVDIGYVRAWGAAPATLVAAVVGAVLGTALCLLGARVLSTGLAGVFQRRRPREIVALVLFLALLGGSVLVQVASQWLATQQIDTARAVALARRVAAVVAWTPFGWPWALPADAAAGAWGPAGARVVLSLAVIGVLGWAWSRQVARGLVSPLEQSGAGERIRSGNVFDRFLPATPAGAIARRGVRYLRRDPRRFMGVIALLLMPAFMILPAMLTPVSAYPSVHDGLLSFAPAWTGWMSASLVAADICYDGSALGTQILSGATGRDDRLGRALGILVVFVPLQLVVITALTLWVQRWDLLPGVLGLVSVLLLGGVGIGSWVGSVWQYAQPPPGGNVMSRGATGGSAGIIGSLVGMFLPLLWAMPTILLAVAAFPRPALGWAALAIGLVMGAAAFAWGIRAGGARLDARWPEVLAKVTWKG